MNNDAMVERRPRRALAIIVAAGVGYLGMAGVYIALGPCRPANMVFVNNTGRNLVVVADGRSSPLPSGGAAEIWPPYNSQELTIQIGGGKVWRYKMAPLEYGQSGVGHSYYLQVEADGSVFVLPFKADRPTQNLPTQPTGYPLRPS
jgi:hypothetical protein